MDKKKTENNAPLARMSRIAPSLDSVYKSTTCQVPIASRPDTPNSEPKIPDGGWGWVVVFATFILCLIADGVTFSFGILYNEFLIEFEASKSVTSWIGSLFMAVPLLTGPIISALVDRFGCRPMTMAGGIIAAAGFVLSSKCYSINWMYVTFGLIAGMGLGFIYVTVVVSVAFWFDKKRTLAVAIGSSGIGIGTFVFSPLCAYMIYELGWRGTTLILGGCFLNMCVCGALMRDPDWIIEQDKHNSKSKLASKASLNESGTINVEELKALLTSENSAKSFVAELETSLANNEDKDKLHNYVQSVVSLPSFVREHEKVPVEVLDLLSTNRNVYNVLLTHYPSVILFKSKSVEDNFSKHKQQVAPWSKDHKAPLLVRRNSFCHSKYFKNLKIDRHSMMHKGALFNTNKYRFKASSCPNIYKVSMVSISKEAEEKWYSEILELLGNMLDFSMFSELHFLLLSFSTIILFTWFIVPHFYLVNLMTERAQNYTTEQASFTISNMGISNMVGMLILGWAGDQPWMNITLTCSICLVLCGLAIAGQMYFVHNFVLLQICASVFGATLSSHFAFTPGIVMELVPMDRFTIAYGLQLLCQGIGTLVGPPYAGLLSDVTKTWEQSFYQAAAWIVLSGVLVGVIPYVKNRKLFGKDPLEKGSEDSRDRCVPLMLLLAIGIICVIVLIYLTATAFSGSTILQVEFENQP